jgi:soluble lytic murein transglycosylase-like protein
MKNFRLLLILISASSCWARPGDESRREAEYYVAAYARHYNVPVEFVRAIVEQESGWQPCPVSRKGAVGLMQLMPDTARRLNVQNRCDLKENISGGVRYLAWLMNRFNGELRLVTAAYFAGERTIERRGLQYSNREVVTYVMTIHERFERQKRLRNISFQTDPWRTR